MQYQISAIALLLLSLVPCPAIAEPSTPKHRAETKTPAAVESITSKLYASDESTARAAVDELVRADQPTAVSALTAFIRNGQPDAITDHVLENLAKIPSPAAVEALEEFTRHRRPSARLRAYQALAAIRAPGASEMVAQGLSDSDPTVRGAAALALGRLGAQEQLPLLFLALERGVREAATAIGQLGDAESVKHFTEYITKIPLTTMLSGYDCFLRREDLSEKAKLEIVAALSELSVGDVKRFFQAFLAGGGAKAESALSKAIETAGARIKQRPPPPATGAPQEGGR